VPYQEALLRESHHPDMHALFSSMQRDVANLGPRLSAMAEADIEAIINGAQEAGQTLNTMDLLTEWSTSQHDEALSPNTKLAAFIAEHLRKRATGHAEGANEPVTNGGGEAGQQAREANPENAYRKVVLKEIKKRANAGRVRDMMRDLNAYSSEAEADRGPWNAYLRDLGVNTSAEPMEGALAHFPITAVTAALSGEAHAFKFYQEEMSARARMMTIFTWWEAVGPREAAKQVHGIYRMCQSTDVAQDARTPKHAVITFLVRAGAEGTETLFNSE
jgi:hypothetical protein